MTLGLLLNDAETPAEAYRVFERRSPLTGDVATVAAAASVNDARRAAAAAGRGFASWSALGPGARREKLLAAAALLLERQDAFIAAMMRETGCTPGMAHFNVNLGAGMLREAAALTTHVTGEIIPSDTPGSFAMAVRQPAGVVLGIAPWNVPLVLGVRAVAAPLACGNAVILKASEMCPETHLMIGRLLLDAGVSDNAVSVVTNAPEDAAEVVEALIAAPEVRRINFTGSTGVGRVIAQLAAQHLKPCLLELGGKAPMLVCEDADLEAAVNAAVFGAFINQGQVCMSTERLIVHERIADAFVTRLTERARALPAGRSDAEGVVVGSMISEDAARRVEDLIDDAKRHGAAVTCGGRRDGGVLPATVVDHVTPQMRLYREESFGPVTAVIRARDEADMIKIANDSDYGLTASVFSRDAARALTLAAQIQSGMCHINGPTVHDEAQMPFGGVKNSGYGRFGGKAGVDAFTELRWITLQTGPRHYPF